MKFLKDFYMNLRIKFKIFLSMITVTVLLLTFVSYFTYDYFYDFSLNQANLEIEKSLDMLNITMNDNLKKLYRDVATFLSEYEIQSALRDIQANYQEDSMNHYLSSQDLFESTIRTNNFIDGMYLLGKNGEFLSTFIVGRSYEFDSHFLFHEDAYSIGHQWLSPTKSPFQAKGQQVIPLVFPIDHDYLYSYDHNVNDNDNVYANLYVFIDKQQLSHFLNQLNKNAESTIVLYNGNQPTTMDIDDPLYDFANSDAVKQFINDNHTEFSKELSYDGDIYRITKRNIGLQNLYVVNFISKTQLLDHLTPLRRTFILTFIIALLLSILLSILLAQSITNPLRKLMVLVNDIKEGKYRESSSYAYNDEVGKLRRQLNDMSGTINTQIEIIKQQEKEHAEAEIDILAQQINPHFLYNTLDCIRWEILNGNDQSSSAMVESLGQYLRLGLNRTSRTISIEREIERIKEYLSIINHRQTSNIRLETVVQEGLRERTILSLILQPLIENCIKHAFTEEVQLIVTEPVITVSFIEDEHHMIITVEDNGIGMDIDNIDRVLSEEIPETSHVGLKNVYLRLKAYYGDLATMTFSSTPFYKNSVILKFPLN